MNLTVQPEIAEDTRSGPPYGLETSRHGFAGVVPALVAGAFAAWLYYVTSASTITWALESQDSGELAACAATLGIPHPTGYPLYTLLGWCAIHLLPHLEPGRVMVLLSVAFGALSVGMIAQLAALAIDLAGIRKGTAFLSAPPKSPPKEGEVGKASFLNSTWWGTLAAGFAAVNSVFWSSAIVGEVYSLAILLQAVFWLFLLKYLEAQRSGSIRLEKTAILGAGLTLGFIFAHQISGAAILLPAAVLFFLGPGQKKLKSILMFISAIIPGLLIYVYLPVRSMQNPRLDWGNPENWRNFLAHVTAGQYHKYMFAVYWPDFLHRLAVFPWESYWTLGGTALFLIGLFVLGVSQRGKTGRVLALSLILYILWTMLFGSGYHVRDYEIFYYPMLIPVSIAIGPGLGWASELMRKRNRFLPVLLALVVVMSLGFSVKGQWPEMDISDPLRNGAAFYAWRGMNDLLEDAIVITSTDGDSFAMIYAVNCGITDPVGGARLGPRDDVDVVIANWVKYKWFRENVAEMWAGSERLKLVSPSFELKPSLRILVEQNLPYRPIFVTPLVRDILVDTNHHYQMERHGVFFQVLGIEPVS